jgi:threonine 3-dehydrogenase
MDTILITGSQGEVGHSLIEYFLDETDTSIIALDLRPQEKDLKSKYSARLTHVTADITDHHAIKKIFSDYSFTGVFHLAAILSSGGEREPERTHGVNVGGTLNLLSAAQESSIIQKKSIRFMFPSTIAVYGIPADEKNPKESIKENAWNFPITMYGNNKLHVENLGTYYSDFYKFLTSTPDDIRLDFRAVRYPGLLSADTMPTGGTSDYGSEMIHAGASGKSYSCFVPPTAKLPFMTMPDAVRAMIELYQAPQSSLTRRSYNVGSFSVTAKQIEEKVRQSFGNIEVTYNPNLKRSAIVASWPGDIDDSKAQKDWNWKSNYSFDSAFSEYLIPSIRKKYA